MSVRQAILFGMALSGSAHPHNRQPKPARLLTLGGPGSGTQFHAHGTTPPPDGQRAALHREGSPCGFPSEIIL